MSAILTLNAGSSSVKFSVYEVAEEPILLIEGQVENLGPAARLILKTEPKEVYEIGGADHTVALTEILKTTQPYLSGHQVVGVGYRIVHGGIDFYEPIQLTDDVMQRLKVLSALAPLHQPHNLSMVEAAQTVFPSAIQIGCFDTAFHHGHPWVNDTFSIPRKFYDEGVRRYGFHGLSYDYITDTLRQHWPALSHSKVVVAHLGNGASMCAIHNGKSVGSSMGFSALDGLPMGTRSGQLDPGVVLYMLDQGLSGDEIARILYQESGLKGLSGISHDMRTLLESDAPEAKQAVDYYVFRIRRELGAMSAVLGGIDALVFCGGIGENAPLIRSRIVDGMDYLGLALDEAANQANEHNIGTQPALVLVIPTNEELVIARAVASRL